MLKNIVNILKEIYKNYIISREEMKLKKYIDEELSESLKLSNFNLHDVMPNTFYLQLREYLDDGILYAYLHMKYSVKHREKAFYANILIRLFGSYLDLYSQCLNNFYDLNLSPLNKEMAPLFESIISQALNNPNNVKKIERVTMEKVRNELSNKYIKNEYFKEIESLLDKEELKSMKILRNYVTHYQPIYANTSQYVSTKKYFKVFTINKADYNLESQEFDKFIDLSEKVIKVYIKLLFYLNKMVLDQKMIPIGQEKQLVYVIQKKDRENEIYALPQQYIEIFKKKFSDHYIVLEETVFVHPEKYEQIVIETLERIDDLINAEQHNKKDK